MKSVVKPWIFVAAGLCLCAGLLCNAASAEDQAAAQATEASAADTTATDLSPEDEAAIALRKRPKRKDVKPLPVNIALRQAFAVKNFDCSNAKFGGDNSKKPEIVEAQRKRVPVMLAEALVTELVGSGYKAERYDETKKYGADTIIIDGEFLQLYQGSGATRAIIGFGAGRGKATVNVKLCAGDDPAKQLTEFEVAGGTDLGSGATNMFANQNAGTATGIAEKIVIRFNVTAEP